MTYEFKFPDVGEGMTEGKLVKWLVKVGDKIKVDQNVAEVETDKAVVEIPSPKTGVVKELSYKEQDTMTVGTKMMLIDEDSNAHLVEKKTEIAEKIVKEEPVVKVEKKVKEEVISKTKQNIVSDRQEGILAMPTIRKFAKQKGIDLSTVKGSGKHGQVMSSDLETQTGHTVTKHIETELQKNSKSISEEILATPSTRKLARELHVDITEVKGTGDHGLITKEDVKRKSKGESIALPISEVKLEHLERKPNVQAREDEQRIPISGIRAAIAKKMLESKHNAAHVTHCDEADVTELYAIRKKEKDLLEEKGIHLTYLPFFMKASLVALKKHPYVNSEMQEKDIVLKKYYNIGFATDTQEGLLVPVINNVEHKSIVEIAQDITQLAQKARDKKLDIKDMQGGTFTITSVGNIGGQMFTPIINFPQVAILGIGKIIDKAVVREGKITIRKMVTLCLSYDHRVIDGAEGARFMNTLIEHVENPNLLFMEMM